MKVLRFSCLILILSLCLSLWGCKFFPTESPASEPSSEAITEKPAEESTKPVPTTEVPTETSTEAPTETEASALEWKDSYATLLTAFRSQYPKDQSDCSYCLYDLNGDMIPELFVKLGTCEADFEYTVFTFTESGAEQIGALSGSHSGLGGLYGQNACLLHTAIQGHESVTKVTMVGRSLTQQVVYEGNPKEYHAFSALTLYQLEDRSGLSFSGNPIDNNQAVLDNFSGGLPYTTAIPFADQSIYSQPSYDSSFVQTVELAGVYTIVEEQWDYEGNLWGRLKSGVGWVDLTDIEYRIYADLPISANFADRNLLNNGSYAYFYDGEGGAAYGFSVAFRAYETLSELRFCRANLAAESGLELEELYAFSSMDTDHAFVADVYFPGDMSAYAIVFRDSEGFERTFILTVSGRNGSLIFYEY